MSKQRIAIIGGGASALMCASFLDPDIFNVTIYEKNKALGRKFLVAGKGGFNLTHGDPIKEMIVRYTPGGFLDESLISFDNDFFRSWLASIGIKTHIGSSGKVYPIHGIKPIEVLQAIKKHLIDLGVRTMYSTPMISWLPHEIRVGEDKTIRADKIIFALGGSSWKVTGSDGQWIHSMKNNQIDVLPFLPMNCGMVMNWKSDFIDKYHGSPLKNIAISLGNKKEFGEIVLTKKGIEGGPIYALSEDILSGWIDNKVNIKIDLKPMFSQEKVRTILQSSTKSITDTLRRDLKLESIKVALLKHYLDKSAYTNKDILSAQIKSFGLQVLGHAPLDKAISTKGGIPISAINNKFELIAYKNHYCIGEMVDWNAPTGGYLLQACFSMGVYLANHLNTTCH